MNWESDAGKEARDRTPLLWAGIAGLVAIMLAALWFTTKSQVADETRARVSHILLKFDPLDDAARQAAIDKANALRKKVLDGANFASVAKESSEDELTQPRGGDMGWVPRGLLVKPVDEVVWQLPVDTVSEPIETQYGIHLVYVDDRTISEYDKYDQSIRDRVYGNAAAPSAESKGAAPPSDATPEP